MKTSFEIRSKINELSTEYRGLFDGLTAENKTETETRAADIMSEIDALQARATNFEKLEASDAQAATRAKSRKPVIADVEFDAATDEEDSDVEAFRSYLRGETRSLTATGNPGMIPTSVLPTILEQLANTGQIFNFVTLQTTSTGAPINVNYRTSPSGEGSYINENDYRGDASDIGLAQKTLGFHTITSNVVGISNTLIRDTDTNILNVLNRDVIQVCANRMEREILLGDGATGHAEGLLTFANVALTTASNTSISYDDLVDLQTSVDSAYDQTSVWVMNKKTLGLVRKIKDDNKMPVLSNPLTAGAPYILLGAPVVLSNKVADFAANAIVMGYGDTAAAGTGRVVSGTAEVKVYNDSTFARVNKTGFQADLDFDFKFVNTSAFKTLKAKS